MALKGSFTASRAADSPPPAVSARLAALAVLAGHQAEHEPGFTESPLGDELGGRERRNVLGSSASAGCQPAASLGSGLRPLTHRGAGSEPSTATRASTRPP